MKKSLLWILVLAVSISMLLTFSVSGCKAEAVEEVVEEVEEAAEEVPAEEEAVEEEAAEEAPAEEIKIVFWLGGAWEFAELFDYMKKIAGQYMEKNPNIELEIVNLSTDTYLEQFEAVGQAGAGPDLIFTWPGIWCLEPVWKGYLAPLDDYIPEEESIHYLGYDQRVWEGKHYGVGYYPSGHPMLYNKALFEEAGLDPDNPPETWDELLDACEALKNAGITPIGFGGSDWGGGYLVGDLSCQMMDSPLTMLEMSIGEEKNFTDPEFSTMWEKMDELINLGYFNEDADSLNLWQGFNLIAEGKVAMGLVGTNCVVGEGGAIDILGDDLGIAVPPAFGSGSQAGKYVLEIQGASITSWSENKQAAADFMMFLHTQDAMNQFYDDIGIWPPDDRFDKSRITCSIMSGELSLIEEKGIADWMENFYPTMVDEQGAMAGTQLLFAGELDGKGVAELCEEIAEKWRASDPEGLENFKKWAETFK